jgi:mono/diheme cytochrome c family protein
MKYLLATAAGMLAAATIGAASLSYTGTTDGKSIFVSNKCANCHSITGQGIERSGKPEGDEKPSDLSTVGKKRTADWMAKWLMKEETLDGKKHMKKFKGSDDELKTLTAWLATLKK